MGWRRLLGLARRLSWLTWIVALVTASALTLIVVPGEFKYVHEEPGESAWDRECREFQRATLDWHIDYNQRAQLSSNILVFIYEHGWPRPFLARAYVLKETEQGDNHVRTKPLLQVKSWFLSWGGSTHLGVHWSNGENWPFAGDGWMFRPWWLVLDLLVSTAILVGVAALTQWWSTSRAPGRRFGFGMRDVLLALTILAIGLAIYRHHHHTRVVEGLATSPLRPPGFRLQDGWMTASQEYCGPVWLRKLAGNEYFPQLFHHVTSARIAATSEHWPGCLRELERFAYLDTLILAEPPPLDDALAVMARLPRLRHLQLQYFHDRRPPAPPGPPDTLDVANLERISELKIESVSLYGSRITAEHLDKLASLPRINRIETMGASVSDEEFTALRAAHPHIRFVVQADWERLLSAE